MAENAKQPDNHPVPEHEKETTTTGSGYQSYFVPDFGISVKARSGQEAYNKAEKQSKGVK